MSGPSLPALIRRFEPVREARRPLQCRRGEAGYRGLCWVIEPYRSVGAGMSCQGCGGVIDPQRMGAPTPDELLAAGSKR